MPCIIERLLKFIDNHAKEDALPCGIIQGACTLVAVRESLGME